MVDPALLLLVGGKQSPNIGAPDQEWSSLQPPLLCLGKGLGLESILL
jgi:hypothetical protein